MRNLLAVTAVVCSVACADSAPPNSALADPIVPNESPLNIVSWNIANLAEAPGEALRGGYVRNDADYAKLRERITGLDPDIIAFQEIGSKAGLEQVLDLTNYTVAFESRCLNNASGCASDDGDIYTAIGYRTALSGVEVFQLDQLAIEHTNECGVRRPVRGGVGVKLAWQGKTVWVPSLHMKASCKDDRIEPGTEDDCETQKAQYDALIAWANSLPKEDLVVLAGDFNRKLLDGKNSIRELMDNELGDSTRYLPTSAQRSCWSKEEVPYDFSALKDAARRNNPAIVSQNVDPFIYTSDANQEIDFFVLSGDVDGLSITSDQIEMTGQYQFANPGSTILACDGETIVKFENSDRALVFGESLPSDHCPITLNLSQSE